MTSITSTIQTATAVYDVGTYPLIAYNQAPEPSKDIQSLNGSVITTLGFTMYVLSLSIIIKILRF